jgi:hypothetical protein
MWAGTSALRATPNPEPDGAAGRLDVFALQQAATVLATVLAHLRGLAEVELRLRPRSP